MTIYNIIYIKNGRIISCRSFSDYHKAKSRLAKTLANIHRGYKSDDGNQEEWDCLDENTKDYMYSAFLFEDGKIEVVFINGDLE